MASDEDTQLAHAAVAARLLDPEKATAALLVYAHYQKLGGTLSFADFLAERGLISRIAIEGLRRSLEPGQAEPARTISQMGDFELLGLLGEGTSGTVFRARQLSTGSLVALKVLSPSLAEEPAELERFLNEARISQRVRHPHLIRIILLARCQGLYYLVMELAEGGSLRTIWRKRGGHLAERWVMLLARHIGSALAAAHAAGLVHRDIKPDNILLDALGQPKLADLGIAVRTRRVARAVPQDVGTGEFWGSPPYVAPEVIAGHGDSDPRSDLYSLGATLFELLAGRPPFQAETPEEVLRLHLSALPPDIRTLRRDLTPFTATVITRLLAKEPSQRFPSADALVTCLEKQRLPGEPTSLIPLEAAQLPAFAPPETAGIFPSEEPAPQGSAILRRLARRAAPAPPPAAAGLPNPDSVATRRASGPIRVAPPQAPAGPADGGRAPHAAAARGGGAATHRPHAARPHAAQEEPAPAPQPERTREDILHDARVRRQQRKKPS